MNPTPAQASGDPGRRFSGASRPPAAGRRPSEAASVTRRHAPAGPRPPPRRGSPLRGLLRRATAVLALCCGPGQAQELVIGVSNTALSLPILVAADQGYFAAEGVAVRLQDCIGGQRCLKLVLDGRAQLAAASDLAVMFSSFERSDYAVIATFVSSVRDLKLLVRKDSGITGARQLEGKRIAIVRGGSTQYFLDSYLLFSGVDRSRITLVALAPDQMAAALDRGEVDAAPLGEPFAYLAIRSMAGRGRLLPTPSIYTATTSLVAGRATIAGRATDLVKILRAVERGQRLIREQPARAQAILLARLGLDAAFIDWIRGDLNYRLSLDQPLVTTLESEARWALREGHVARDRPLPDYLDFIDPAILRSAVPGAATIVK